MNVKPGRSCQVGGWSSGQLQMAVLRTSYFFPLSVRSLVLQWGHSSRVACHLGFHRTLIRQKFWCPSVTADTREFVGACSVCARSKSTHRAPAGLLCPLPIPRHPESRIAVDFPPPLCVPFPAACVCGRRRGWLLSLCVEWLIRPSPASQKPGQDSNPLPNNSVSLLLLVFQC